MTAGLSDLLLALRAAGLPIGATELLRLQAVFARAPAFGEGGEALARFKGLVRAVVVKRREDDAAFERVFGEWEARLDLEGKFEISSASIGIGGFSPNPRRRLRLRRVWKRAPKMALVLISTVLAVLALFRWNSWRHPAKPFPTAKPIDTTAPIAPPTALQAPIPSTGWKVHSYETTMTFRLKRQRDRWLLPLSLGLFSLTAAVGLTWLSRRQGFFSPPAPFVASPGPSRVFLSPPPQRGSLLLESQEEEALIYGVGRFISEEPSRRLNVPATVRAIVQAAGLPRLVFERACFHREVWLWIDETAESPTLPRAVAEVEASLAAHGLPFERASFRGVPTQLISSNGQVFAPSEVDERREAAIVAILTDGRLFSLQAEEGDRWLRLQAMLRFLSGWPRLAFFDSTGNAHKLSGLLKPHGLISLPLSYLPEFLGGSRLRVSRSLIDVDFWAAACALAPSPVSEATALALRQRLDLPVPAWGLSELAAQAPGPAGRLSFEPAVRTRLLDHLVASESHPVGQVAEGSVLARSLDAWEELYEGEETKRQESPVPWEGTLAARRLQMEKMLLKLWRYPEQAAAKLFELFSGPLQAEIEDHLRRLAPAGQGGVEQTPLPWRWENLKPVTRAQLQTMKLGGDLPIERLRRSGVVWLFVGLSTGLGFGALGTAAKRYEKPPPVSAPVRVRVDKIQAQGRSSRMILVRIPGGEFLMGSNSGDEDEKPVHRVVVNEFWIGQTEVTNDQYLPSQLKHFTQADLPVVNISWQEADNYCRNLGEGYRLPTEAEWEYAARANTQTAWFFGEDETKLGQYAWHLGNSGIEAQPVAKKLPNPWGLFDMHGNVQEWVSDWYDPSYKGASAQNPQGPKQGVYRALRGGSFVYLPRFLRSAVRFRGWPKDQSEAIGFRCVLTSIRQKVGT